jgi:RimJ/RimL family protein N-acetyltransferase
MSCAESTTLEGSRIYLRDFLPEDALPLFQIESDPDMVRYQNFPVRTEETAQAYALANVAEAAKEAPAWAEFAVCLKDSGEFIGRVGGSPDTEGAGILWIWYVIAKAHQRKGFAAEACNLLIASLHGYEEVRIECNPRNTASCRLAERLGFRHDLAKETPDSRTYSLKLS